MDVITIGNIVADFVAAPVSKVPAWGELYNIERPITLNIGGNAAIFSACASRLGLKAGLLGMVGDDEIGKILLSNLDTAEVDTSHVKLSKETPTSVTLAIANETGERSFYHHFGANEKFTIDDIDLHFIDMGKALLLCAYFIMPGLEGAPAKKILEYAKSKGMITFFDVAWDPSGNWKLGDFLENINVFMPNEDEIVKLTKTKDISTAVQKFLDAGVQTVAVKMGGKGCYIESNEGEKIRLKAHKVKAIDTTGAGDTFNAGFVYGILANWDLERTARFANAAAAFSVMKLGGTTGAPTVDEVEEFLKG